MAKEAIMRYDAWYNLLKKLLEIRSDKVYNIIEVGCEGGTRTIELLTKNKNIKATLVDIYEGSLIKAENNVRENGVEATLVLADAFDLPFQDETFDIVWNGGVNEHYKGEKRQLIFDEMVRVCKIGGQVAVIVPNAWNLPYRVKKIFWSRFEKPFSIFELRRRMKKAGVTLTKARGARSLSSVYLLGEFLVRDVNLGNRYIAFLRKSVLLVDNIIGFMGGFTGVAIGVMGVKEEK